MSFNELSIVPPPTDKVAIVWQPYHTDRDRPRTFTAHHYSWSEIGVWPRLKPIPEIPSVKRSVNPTQRLCCLSEIWKINSSHCPPWLPHMNVGTLQQNEINHLLNYTSNDALNFTYISGKSTPLLHLESLQCCCSKKSINIQTLVRL